MGCLPVILNSNKKEKREGNSDLHLAKDSAVVQKNLHLGTMRDKTREKPDCKN